MTACHRRILGGRRDLLAPAAAFPQRYPCLLESVLHGTPQARFDILFAFPQDSLALAADGHVRNGAGDVVGARFLDALDAAWQAGRQPREDDGLPFHGGWALLLCYELAGEIEPKLRLRADAVLPTALALRCPVAAIVDHARDCTVLVAEAGSEHLLDALQADLA
ncbi:MAG: aminodeoxychorismate synthase, component I, partial [Xanthomonadaceae bacterium]|nr:aminodeoxychorismate synthase, component I [Xanthomonadaceae bacterium]